MDFWNRRKVKDLEMELKRREIELENANNKIESLQSKIKGDRICTAVCSKCEHGIKITVNQAIQFGFLTDIYVCELDVKCKDFKRKDNG